MNDRIMKNYREADRRRKERERREREEQMDRLEAETRQAVRRANNAEGRYEDIARNTRVLPTEFMANIVGAMIRRMMESYADHPALDELTREFMKRVIVRIDEYRYPMGVEVVVVNDSPTEPPTVTVTIPELRITQILDEDFVQTLTGNRGPVIQPDRPIQMARAPDVSFRYDDGEDLSKKTEFFTI